MKIVTLADKELLKDDLNSKRAAEMPMTLGQAKYAIDNIYHWGNRWLKLPSSNGTIYFEEYLKDNESVFSQCAWNFITEEEDLRKEDFYNIEGVQTALNDMESIELHNEAKISYNLSEDTVTLGMLSPLDYTNTVDISSVRDRLVQSNLSSRMDLAIEYVKSGKIYNQICILEPFSYNDDAELIEKRYSFEICSDIQVEYLDGQVKALSLNPSEVSECIISSCTLTYGSF